MEIVCSSCGKIISWDSFPEDQKIEIEAALKRGAKVIGAMCPECKKDFWDFMDFAEGEFYGK